MITFVPYTSITACAKCLDRARLGKQRLECRDILQYLEGKRQDLDKFIVMKYLKNMWREHELALTYYGLAMCEEWMNRGYKDTIRDSFYQFHQTYYSQGRLSIVNNSLENLFQEVKPYWWGDERIHDSHKANLIRKEPLWYESCFPNIEPRNGYIWVEEKFDNGNYLVVDSSIKQPKSKQTNLEL